MPPTDTEELARKIRDEQIRVLEACTCRWPLERYRNGSGHADDCPAHGMFMAKKEERQA